MIDVAKHELKTILDILNKHVNECEVRAFGSRVTWTNKDSSDLDIVVVCDKKLDRGRIVKLREAFDESSLPFTVDVIDWQGITKEFQKNIEKSFYVLKKAYKKTNNDWQYYKVSDFADVMSGGTPKTGVSEYWNGNIPWLTPKDLSNYNAREISRGERNISLEGLKNSSAKILPQRTVLLTSRAPVGYLAIAKNELTTNQGFKNLIVKNGFSPEFIYYLLLNNVDYLKLQASGSTFQELTASTLRNLEFLLPEYAVQEEIALILGNIDDKIELLREQNKTLEAIAQAIYKRWFVDFEFPVEAGNALNPLPVKDEQVSKADGVVFNTLQLKGYKSSGGKMVESELGEIPKEWVVAHLGDNIIASLLKTGIDNFEGEKIYLDTASVQGSNIIDLKNKIIFKQRPSRANMQPKINSIWFANMKNSKKALFFDTYSEWELDNFEGEKIYLDTASVQSSNIIDLKNKIIFKQRPSRANMQPKINSIWFAKMKNSKKALFFDTYSEWELDNFILSTGFAGLDVNVHALYYLWNFIISDKFKLEKDNFCNGTTMQAINNENIQKIKILIPAEEILILFSNIIRPLYKKIHLNWMSIQTLSALRDSLLPKLMSGKIRVSTTPAAEGCHPSFLRRGAERLKGEE